MTDFSPELKVQSRPPQTKAFELSLAAKTPRYFKAFVHEFDSDFAAEIRAARRVSPRLTRFSLSERRKLAQTEDYFSGLARFIYMEIDLEHLLSVMIGKEPQQYMPEFAKIVTDRTGSIWESPLYQRYSKRRETKIVKQPTVRMNNDESSVFLSSFVFAVGSVVDLIQQERQSQRAAIRNRIDKSARSAPVFEQSGGRIRYREQPSTDSIAERKRITRMRCMELIDACRLKENQQPDLSRLAKAYGKALTALRKDRGVYHLLLAGLDTGSAGCDRALCS